jgi:hypothetical protein
MAKVNAVNSGLTITSPSFLDVTRLKEGSDEIFAAC